MADANWIGGVNNNCTVVLKVEDYDDRYQYAECPAKGFRTTDLTIPWVGSAKELEKPKFMHFVTADDPPHQCEFWLFQDFDSNTIVTCVGSLDWNKRTFWAQAGPCFHWSINVNPQSAMVGDSAKECVKVLDTSKPLEDLISQHLEDAISQYKEKK